MSTFPEDPSTDHEKLLDLCRAVAAYLIHLRRSVDVGPATANPHTEAIILQHLRKTLLRVQP